jgi:hypothetical protein
MMLGRNIADMTRAVLLTILLAVVAGVSGCDSEATAARDRSKDRAGAVRQDADSCSEIVVPHGFALGWQRFNHRISRWGVGLDHDDCRASRLNVSHVGGVFSTNPVLSDQPWVRFRYQKAALDEDVGAARVSLQDVVDSSGAVSGEISIDLAELGLEGFDHYTALLEGIRYDTSIPQGPEYPSLYSPGRGYTIRGLGASVDVEARGVMGVIDYTIHFEAGPTPERVFMNRTLPYAEIGAELDVLVIGTNADRVTQGAVQYAMQHERPIPFMDTPLPEAEEEVRTASVQGKPDAPRGFYGLRSFHFSLDFDSDCSSNDDCTLGSCRDGKCDWGIGQLGEYIREFAVGVQMEEFDPQSGGARFVVDGYTSNASSFLAYYPLNYTFDGSFVWIQAGSGSDTHAIEEDFDTGMTSFPLVHEAR